MSAGAMSAGVMLAGARSAGAMSAVDPPKSRSGSFEQHPEKRVGLTVEAPESLSLPTPALRPRAEFLKPLRVSRESRQMSRKADCSRSAKAQCQEIQSLTGEGRAMNLPIRAGSPGFWRRHNAAYWPYRPMTPDFEGFIQLLRSAPGLHSVCRGFIWTLSQFRLPAA
jgi:hypothetical protein